jgi:hypothetical protein
VYDSSLILTWFQASLILEKPCCLMTYLEFCFLRARTCLSMFDQIFLNEWRTATEFFSYPEKACCKYVIYWKVFPGTPYSSFLLPFNWLEGMFRLVLRILKYFWSLNFFFCFHGWERKKQMMIQIKLCFSFTAHWPCFWSLNFWSLNFFFVFMDENPKNKWWYKLSYVFPWQLTNLASDHLIFDHLFYVY